MNQITRNPLASLGYNFIPAAFRPKGKDEYYLRNKQHRNGTIFKPVSKAAIRILEKNGNSSDDWTMVQVADGFDPELVKNCKFFGLIRIGKIEPSFVEFNNLRIPAGLYNSTIISCDIGNNVAIDNVNFMSHYIIGNEAILVNINELATTDHSKFGNGVLKDGENEAVRIWMEVGNENGGRRVLPFNGMLAGDAWLWSKYRDDEVLLKKFKEFTDNQYDTKRGYYGKIGERTVIKNCRIIKDVWIGSDAYIKGANKLKNLTINSGPEKKQSQIGEGVELVNGIIGFGCRIFYGVKAVRFQMGHNSQLKYGARLINSYLGDNSTISCCEVLNSLIFPAHEQHHNNSFLCAAVVLGQSNMAAGATIGSNHNSRGADGEIIAGRGFWPGLCVSLKHNSRFASFTLIAKGDFPSEISLPIPFSLISNDVSSDRLLIMPGYWFRHNMYALARNAGKYKSRDKRPDDSQILEYDYLAPDSIEEILDALPILRKATALAWSKKNKKIIPAQDLEARGQALLDENGPDMQKLEIFLEGIENSERKVQLLRAGEAHKIFKDLILYYGVEQLLTRIKERNIKSWDQLLDSLPDTTERIRWINIGGQLIPANAVKNLLKNIHSGKIGSWDQVHDFYIRKSKEYKRDKFHHAMACLFTILEIHPKKFTKKLFSQVLQQAVETNSWILQQIVDSRTKDYENPFRQMVYDTRAEMDKVLGPLSENSFIREQQAQANTFKNEVDQARSKFSIKPTSGSALQ